MTFEILKSLSLHSADPMRAASSFDLFFHQLSALIMTNPTRSPSLVPLVTTYRDYLSRSNTNTFRGRYAAVLDPYSINPTASAAAAAPADNARLIYAAVQEGVVTNFLQWYHVTRGRGAQTSLLHSLPRYIPRMGLLASPWDDLYFMSKLDVPFSAVACAN